MDPSISSASPSGRPKRKTANVVSYKEKSEHDIGSQLVVQPPKKQQKTNGTKKSTSSTSLTNGSSASASSANTSKKTDSKSIKNDSNLYIPIDDEYPWNWQPPFRPVDKFNNVLDLQNAKIDSINMTMTFKDGTIIKKNDFIYMVCEPPTEPYYIARVLGFTKKDKTNNTKSIKNYLFNVCWFYRPRDLSRKDNDSRVLYASLHNDECPIQSFRGFVTVKHKSEIDDIEKYRSKPNCFYFDKLYDRYMIKLYEVLPTKKLINLPPNYYKALNKRYEYVFVENGRASDLLSAPKNCDKCFQWCSTTDSIQCHKCEKYYHLLCLDPPILTKPKRGFGWYCAACNRTMEKELTEKRGKMLESNQLSLLSKIKKGEQEDKDEDQDQDQDEAKTANEEDGETPTAEEGYENNEYSNSSNSLAASQTDDSKEQTPSYHIPKYEELAMKFLESDSKISLEKRRIMEEWPYRYLGMHAKLEDALDLQDRPYARAASRLGAKHQFTGMCDWFDHNVVYYDPLDASNSSKGKPKGKKGNAANFKKSSNTLDSSVSPSPDDSNLENIKLKIPEEFKDTNPKDFPPWLQKRPKGYIERGSDSTATLLWRSPEDLNEDVLNDYISKCEVFAKNLNMIPTSPNFVDSILYDLMESNFDVQEALKKVSTYTRLSLKEPTFSVEEVKRFEESVKKNGSELYPVFKDVQTQPSSMIVRFYYLWKKTPRGHLIWDNYEGRTKNRLKQNSSPKVKKEDSNINDSGDDSAYSSLKITRTNAHIECKHCHTHKSVQWFKAPGGLSSSESESNFSSALCLRCARLWRRYGVEWELPNEVVKKQIQKGGNGWKRKVETELVEDAYKIINAREKYKLKPKKMSQAAIAAASALAASSTSPGTPLTSTSTADNSLLEDDSSSTDRSRTGTPAPSSGDEKKPKSKKRSATNNDSESQEDNKLSKQKSKRKKYTKKELVKSEEDMELDTTTALDNLAAEQEAKRMKPNKGLKIKRSQTKENSFTVVIPYASGESSSSKNRANSKIKVGEKIIFDSQTSKDIHQHSQLHDGSNLLVSEPSNFVDVTKKRALEHSRFEQSCHPLSDSRKYPFETTLKLSERYLSNYDMALHPKTTKSSGLLFDATKGKYEDSLAEWRFYHSKVHDTGSKSKLLKLPLFSPTNKPCCVCRESDNISEMVICVNCGLNVHASCYGLVLSQDDVLNKAYLRKWCCDPCSNDLHPVATTHYSCCLCSSKESDHDAAIKGESCAFPDALKRTVNGRWVHVICSLFSEDCQYGNPVTLQPVAGTDITIYANLNKLCMICGVVGGGLTGCRLCDKKFHVTCCQDVTGFSVGFEIVAPKLGDTDKDKGFVKIKELGEGKPTPIIICRNHTQEQINQKGIKFLSMRTPCKKRNLKEEQPIFQIYIKDFKRSLLTGGFLLRDNYDKLVKKYAETSENQNAGTFIKDDDNKGIYDTLFERQLALNTAKIEQIKCIYCNTTKSLNWYNSNTTCHKCYVRLQINTSVEDIKLPDITKITNKPLDGSKLGIHSLGDTLENYNINSKNNGYQPSKVSINNLLS